MISTKLWKLNGDNTVAIPVRTIALIFQSTSTKFRSDFASELIEYGLFATGDFHLSLFTASLCSIAGSRALMSAYYPSIWQIRKIHGTNSAHKSAD